MTRLISWTGLDGRRYTAALDPQDWRLLILTAGHPDNWSPGTLDHYCRYAGMASYWTPGDDGTGETVLSVVN